MFKTRQIIFLQLDKTLQNIATGIFLNLNFGKIFYFFILKRSKYFKSTELFEANRRTQKLDVTDSFEEVIFYIELNCEL